MHIAIIFLLFAVSKTSASIFFDDRPFLNYTKTDVYFKNYYNPLFNQTIDFLEFLSSHSEINLGCRSSLRRWIKGIGDNEIWALKFLEATGKTVNGKLLGRNVNFGSFGYCVEFMRNEVEKIDFDGKYCLVSLQTRESEAIKNLKSYKRYQLKLSDRSKRLVDFSLGSGHGVCMPSTCDMNEITTVFNKKFEPFGFSLLPPKQCTTATEPEPLTNLQIISFSVFAIFILLTILSLCFDHEFLSNFSFVDNYRIIYAKCRPKDEDSDSVKTTSILHGLKAGLVISSCGFHCFVPYIIFFVFPFDSINELVVSSEKTFSFSAMIKVFLERIHLIADQLFFFGGFFAMFAWYTILKKKKHLSISFVPFFIFRYIRVVITVVPMILLFFLLPWLGFGPFYSDLTNHFSDNCKEGSHYIFLLMGYKQSALDMCIIPAWFFNADFQIYILNYFLIFYLITKPTVGFLLSIGQMIIFSVFTLLQTEKQQLPTFLSLLRDVKSYDLSNFEDTYFNLYTHYNTYVLGLLCAYLIQNKIRPKILTSKLVRLGVWLFVGSLALFAFLYPYYLERTNSAPNQVIAFLFPIFDKIFLTSLFFWFVYSMLSGYADFLTPIFSCKMWVPISRLSFSIIVAQFVYLGWTFPTSRSTQSINFVPLIKEWASCILFSFAIGNFVFFFFEAPLISMMKRYFGLKGRHEKSLKLAAKEAKLNEINNNIECEGVKTDDLKCKV